MTLRDLPQPQRPRERLLREGPAALADYELLAIVLGGASAGEHALSLAMRLLADGGLFGLRQRGAAPLLAERGIGPARAAQVAAALELGRRSAHRPQGRRLHEPQRAFDYLRGRFDPAVEELVALLLDGRLRLIGEVRLARGGQGALAISAADVLRPAVRAGAKALVLAHNHPGGDPTPSRSDVTTTISLRHAAATLGVQLVDHLVIGDNGYVSMRLAGHWSEG